MRWPNGNPWWVLPFLGRVPALPPRLVSLLGLVSLALFFDSYDISMLTSALRHIADDLGIPETSLGGTLAVIRLGSLPVIFVIPLTDRIGRRPAFLAGVVGAGLCTLATAFAQSASQFVALQMVSRIFMVVGVAAALVIITEEFPAEHRGWAIGMIGALAACGHGLGAILFAAIDVLPGGWRFLYAVGVVPLAFLPRFRARVPETGRFAAHRASRTVHAPTGWFVPLVSLARTYPARAALLALAAFLFAVSDSPVFQFTGYFTQKVLGFPPWVYSSMVIVGGGIGIIGNIVAGRLSDGIGRRAVGAIFLSAFPLAAYMIYQSPAWVVPLGFVLFVFSDTAGSTVVRALSTELFPTSHRGTSAGWIAFVETLGWSVGLALVGLGTRAGSTIAIMATALSVPALVGGLILLLLPETRQRELEAISHEDALSA
jgi:MFS family permease